MYVFAVIIYFLLTRPIHLTVVNQFMRPSRRVNECDVNFKCSLQFYFECVEKRSEIEEFEDVKRILDNNLARKEQVDKIWHYVSVKL